MPLAGQGMLLTPMDIGAVSAVIAERFTGPAASPSSLPMSVGTYRLMWDLAKDDIKSDIA